jgi:hypothetical protein
VRKQMEMNTTLVRACIWSGPLLIVAMIVAQGALMHFIPPPSPDLTDTELAQKFIDRADEIRIGAVLQCICWSFWATWGVAIIIFLRKMERGYPILTMASIALVGGGYVFFILIPMTWAVIAFRPESLDPSLMQIMNDWVWFDFLFTWPPFALWMVVIGIAILSDRNDTGLYPRWAAYMNFWCAVAIFPAGLIAFFKTGPFAYDGLLAFWFPFAVFFGWMVTMTVLTLKATTIEDARLQAEADAEAAGAAAPQPDPEGRAPVPA